MGRGGQRLPFGELHTSVVKDEGLTFDLNDFGADQHHMSMWIDVVPLMAARQSSACKEAQSSCYGSK